MQHDIADAVDISFTLTLHCVAHMTHYISCIDYAQVKIFYGGSSKNICHYQIKTFVFLQFDLPNFFNFWDRQNWTTVILEYSRMPKSNVEYEYLF